MSFAVGDFKAKIDESNSGGFARANIFRVVINDLSATASITDTRDAVGELGKDLLVKAAQVPGSTIAPLPINYGGRVIKLTGFRTFDNWTVTILNDEDFGHRTWIQNWMYAIAGSAQGDRSGITTAIGGMYNLATDATVKLYNNKGVSTNVWELRNIWPTSLGDVSLDWGTDGIEEYTVEFAYEYWTHGNATVDPNAKEGDLTEVENVVPASVPT